MLLRLLGGVVWFLSNLQIKRILCLMQGLFSHLNLWLHYANELLGIMTIYVINGSNCVVYFCCRSYDDTQLSANYPGDGASPVRKKRKSVQFAVMGGEGDSSEGLVEIFKCCSTVPNPMLCITLLYSAK